MAPGRKAPFKVPFRAKSSTRSVASGRSNAGRSVTSARSNASRRTSGGSMATDRSRNAAPRPPQQPSRAQPEQFVQNSESTRAPSESVAQNERDDTLNEIIMAVDLSPGATIGCCYYVARDEKMFFMEDIQMSDVDVVDALRMFIDPTVILVSTKIDDTVIDRFDPEAKNGSSVSGDNDQFRLPFLLEVRPPSEFYYDAAKSKLVTLRLEEENGTRVSFNVPGELAAGNRIDDDNVAGQQGQLLRLAGWVDVESRVTVSAIVEQSVQY
jgi:DNA mismatch repair protein MSH5